MSSSSPQLAVAGCTSTNGLESGQSSAATPPLPASLNAFFHDWSDSSTPTLHLWTECEAREHLCYVCGESRTSSKGPRQRCMACKITAHVRCMSSADLEKIPPCRPTFRMRDDAASDRSRHHWVNQRKPTGRCTACTKAFQQKFLLASGGGKEIVAVGCSWCKQMYHHSCFQQQLIDAPCSLGEFASLIVPPSWLVKLPPSGKEDGSPTTDSPGKNRRRRKSRREKDHSFTVQPRRAPNKKPLLVFVNPKSGGNQGAKLLPKFLWLLNPRQVFNLLDGGPKIALRLYSQVARLRILVCGGDGTAGWILSAIDELGIQPCPPVAVLPIGTGNDLARTLNWGGSYTDEPIVRILHQVSEAAVVHLDRWDLARQPGAPAPEVISSEESLPSVDELPLNVMNNYFSIGADALVALEFHESREANPERFTSRWYNRMYYATAGGRELVERKLRDLSKHLGVIADDVDLTPRIREAKFTVVLFLNIPRYSAGTQPWGVPSDTAEFSESRPDDGRIEIVGFTTMSLAALQMGGHGVRLAQARNVTIVTSRTLPVQVDGEPCRLAPSNIQISLRNTTAMLTRVKRRQVYSASQNPDPVQSSQLPDISTVGTQDEETRRVPASPSVHVFSNPMQGPMTPPALSGGWQSPQPLERSSTVFYTNAYEPSQDDTSQHLKAQTLPSCAAQSRELLEARTPSPPADSPNSSPCEHRRLCRAEGVDKRGDPSLQGELSLHHGLVNACKQGKRNV